MSSYQSSQECCLAQTLKTLTLEGILALHQVTHSSFSRGLYALINQMQSQHSQHYVTTIWRAGAFRRMWSFIEPCQGRIQGQWRGAEAGIQTKSLAGIILPMLLLFFCFFFFFFFQLKTLKEQFTQELNFGHYIQHHANGKTRAVSQTTKHSGVSQHIIPPFSVSPEEAGELF